MCEKTHLLARIDRNGKRYSVLCIHKKNDYTGPFCPEHTVLLRTYWTPNLREAELYAISHQNTADLEDSKNVEYIVVPVTVAYIDPGEWQTPRTRIPSVEVLREEIRRRRVLLLGPR